MKDRFRIFANRREAIRAFPTMVSATSIRDLVRDQYCSLDLPATNLGNIGKAYNRTVMFYKGNEIGSTFGRKVGHLYDPKDVPFYVWMLHLLSVNRHIITDIPFQMLEQLDERYAEEIGIYHRHHIVPKHAGGNDDPENLITLSVYKHALAHKQLYQEHRRYADLWAWRRLTLMCLKKDIFN